MSAATDSVHIIKAVQLALGPDAKCDPYPSKEYKDGADLFNKKYAEEFYAAHPDLVGVPFKALKKHHAKNPWVDRVIKEFSDENKRYMAIVDAWREKWPEEAKIVDEARKKSSAQRKDRKNRRKMEMLSRSPPGGARYVRSGHTLPWLTREWVKANMLYIKKCRETGLKLLHTADEMQDAYEEHREFIQELERDREDVF